MIKRLTKWPTAFYVISVMSVISVYRMAIFQALRLVAVFNR